jgi:hypothetical protein
MATIDDDLRVTSESLEADAKRLTEIEREKQRLPADHPRMPTLSSEAERLGRTIETMTRVELDVANEAAGEA